MPAGTHVVSGLSGQLTWNGNVNVVAGQCTLYELNAPGGGGGAGPTGQISVWTDYPYQIAVRIDGSSVGTLANYFSNGAPTCGQAGTITLTVPAGTHAISGVSGSITWSGTATVVAGQCTLFRLEAPAGGGNNSGQISVWTNYPYQVAVSVDGSSVGTTTTYFPNGSPTCAQAGTITVSAGAGVHNVSARSGQVTWNGNVTVIAGECTLYELRAP